LLILQRSVLHSPTSPRDGHILTFAWLSPVATTRTSHCATGIVHGFWNMAWPRLLNLSLKENPRVYSKPCNCLAHCANRSWGWTDILHYTGQHPNPRVPEHCCTCGDFRHFCFSMCCQWNEDKVCQSLSSSLF
jgi:hypothetical protein